MRFFGIILIVLLSVSSYADRVHLITNDKDAFKARLDLIQQAKSEILFEYFSVWNDEQSVANFALLLNAAKRGVHVKIIVDALAYRIPKSFFTALEEQAKDSTGNINIEIRLYNPPTMNLAKLTHRDHSKLLIIDGNVMITGGRNIGDKYFGFSKKRNVQDVDIVLDGPAVQDAREDFLSLYNSNIVKSAVADNVRPSRFLFENCNKPLDRDRARCRSRRRRLMNAYAEATQRLEMTLNKVLAESPTYRTDSTEEVKDWLAGVRNTSQLEFLSHQPDKLVNKKNAYLSYELEKLALTAKRDLQILSPYVIPTKPVLQVFQTLIDRGVKIKIITNSVQSTDNYFAQAAYLASKKKLIEMGIELYEFRGPDTSHGKGLIIDNEVAFVGTFNLDPRSMYLNREVGVVIRNDDEFMSSFKEELDQLTEQSLLVGKDGYPQNVEEQALNYKTLSKGKRMLLKIIHLFIPIFRNQV